MGLVAAAATCISGGCGGERRELGGLCFTPVLVAFLGLLLLVVLLLVTVLVLSTTLTSLAALALGFDLDLDLTTRPNMSTQDVHRLTLGTRREIQVRGQCLLVESHCPADRYRWHSIDEVDHRRDPFRTPASQLPVHVSCPLGSRL